MSFYISAALLCALAILAVLTPWFLGAVSWRDRRGAVVGFAKARLAELESDYRNGIIDADEFHQLSLEQQRRLLQEVDASADVGGNVQTGNSATRGRIWLIAFAVLLPVFSAAFYFYTGSWSDWRIQQLLEQSASDIRAGEDNRATLEQLRDALEKNLKHRDDKDGRKRFMLAQLDMQFERYNDAAAQFGSILKQFPEDANIAGQYAQALYLASNRQLTPEVLAQAQRALQLDSNQTTALGLLGIAAFERKDFAQALIHWRHLLRLLPPSAASRTMIERGIQQAEQQLGPEGLPGPKFIVSVSLSNDLIESQPSGGTLFVFAKAVAGPPMPLAVARLESSKLPIEVTLDNSMAMAPGMDLSSAKQVQIFARITASGQVRGEAGDLEGNSETLNVSDATQRVVLKIDRKL
ncbi:MAG: c-type cytochrome biogenesis protein CcmI [Spongiibacteraceae bacterium]